MKHANKNFMKSLKTSTLFLILLISISGGLGLFITAISFSTKAIKTVLEADLKNETQMFKESIETKNEANFKLIDSIGHIPSIQSSQYSMFSKQDQLDSVANQDKTIIGFNLTDDKGNCRVREGGMVSFAERDYFKKAIKGQKNIYGPILNKVTNALTLFYAAPLYDENGKINNTIFMPDNGAILCDICSEINVGKYGYALVIDRTTGNTIGHPDIDVVANFQNIPKECKDTPQLVRKNAVFEDLMKGNTGYAYYEGTESKNKLMNAISPTDMIISYMPIKNTDWTAAIIVPYSEYNGYLKGLKNTMFIVTLIVIILASGVIVYIAKSINPLQKLGNAINEIASGNADLTQRLNIQHAKTEIEDVVIGFNNFVEKLQSIITSMKNSELKLTSADSSLQSGTQDTAAAITQIISNIENVGMQISSQANSVDETAGAVNEISSNIESLEKMIINQASGVSQASSAVEQMVGNISSVNNSMEKMASSFIELEQNASTGITTQADVNERIKQIEEESKMLQDANSAIASIASQTNLLAMNAAIEAAHAGEAGKGFSVVADEIRKLSETSTQQSKQIGNELKKIQESIDTVVSASSKANAAFTSVSESIHNTDELVRQIKNAMEEQQIGSKQITDALHSMNDSTLEVRAASAEMSEGSKHILAEITRLQGATTIIKNSIEEMSHGAQRISATGNSLSMVSKEVTDSVIAIRDEIDLFKV